MGSSQTEAQTLTLVRTDLKTLPSALAAPYSQPTKNDEILIAHLQPPFLAGLNKCVARHAE
jgi:hypothetical protein